MVQLFKHTVHLWYYCFHWSHHLDQQNNIMVKIASHFGCRLCNVALRSNKPTFALRYVTSSSVKLHSATYDKHSRTDVRLITTVHSSAVKKKSQIRKPPLNKNPELYKQTGFNFLATVITEFWRITYLYRSIWNERVKTISTSIGAAGKPIEEVLEKTGEKELC